MKIAKETSYDLKQIREVDEKQKKSFWYNYAMTSSKDTNLNITTAINNIPFAERIFVEQAKMIEEIAQNESCIIIGRCSNYILREYSNAIHIFIYSSDIDFKVNRKKKYAKMDNYTDVRKLIEKTDKERAEYYKSFTAEEWGARNNYDLFIDSSKIGVENTAKMICEYVNMKKTMTTR